MSRPPNKDAHSAAAKVTPSLNVVSDDALSTLLGQVREFAADDPAPDPMELTRMWLLTTVTAGGNPADLSRGSVYVTEVHASARLLHTADGRAYLTPVERELIGFGFAIPDIGLPSPNELDDWLTEQLAAHQSGQSPRSRSDKWRLQRLARQLPRAARTPQRWASFVLRNDVAYIPSTVFGVWLADGRRVAMLDSPDAPDSVLIARDADFWDCNPFSGFGLALCSA